MSAGTFVSLFEYAISSYIEAISVNLPLILSASSSSAFVPNNNNIESILPLVFLL